MHDIVVNLEIVEEGDDNTDGVENVIQKLVNAVTQRIETMRVRSQIDLDPEMLNSSEIVVDNNNDPLSENYLNVTEEECVCKNWDHLGICHQCQVVSYSRCSFKITMRKNDELE